MKDVAVWGRSLGRVVGMGRALRSGRCGEDWIQELECRRVGSKDAEVVGVLRWVGSEVVISPGVGRRGRWDLQERAKGRRGRRRGRHTGPGGCSLEI